MHVGACARGVRGACARAAGSEGGRGAHHMVTLSTRAEGVPETQPTNRSSTKRMSTATASAQRHRPSGTAADSGKQQQTVHIGQAAQAGAAGGAGGGQRGDKDALQRLGFIHKLVRILDESDPAVVGWCEGGQSFAVRDAKRCVCVCACVCCVFLLAAELGAVESVVRASVLEPPARFF